MRPDGRLGLVLPAELLTTNYAGPVRRYLTERFANVRLIMFDERVFPDVQEEVVLLLADGHATGPGTDHIELARLRDLDDWGLETTRTLLASAPPPRPFTPEVVGAVLEAATAISRAAR